MILGYVQLMYCEIFAALWYGQTWEWDALVWNFLWFLILWVSFFCFHCRLLQKARLKRNNAVVIRDSLRNEMSKRSKTEEENREKREQLVIILFAEQFCFKSLGWWEISCSWYHCDRAIFSWVIRDCIGFALLRSVIGPKNSCLSLSQPIKCKTNINHDMVARVFPRCRQFTRFFPLSLHWLFRT